MIQIVGRFKVRKSQSNAAPKPKQIESQLSFSLMSGSAKIMMFNRMRNRGLSFLLSSDASMRTSQSIAT